MLRADERLDNIPRGGTSAPGLWSLRRTRTPSPRAGVGDEGLCVGHADDPYGPAGCLLQGKEALFLFHGEPVAVLTSQKNQSCAEAGGR